MSTIRVMPIIRSRSGCFTCRRRKKKCNEEKPVCSGCRRNKLDCRWPAEGTPSAAAALRSRSSASPTSPSPDSASPGGGVGGCAPLASPASVIMSGAGDAWCDGDGPRGCEPACVDSLTARRGTAMDGFCNSPTAGPGPGPGAGAAADLDGSGPGGYKDAADQLSADRLPPGQPPSDHLPADQLSAGQVRALCQQADRMLRPGVAAPMALLPSHGHSSYELLSHYLSRTANSMGNGSTAVNPFIAKLMPLALSNPLVLQLILAQSAAHRQASSRLSLQGGHEMAQQYYTDSLRRFRHVVGDYVSGNDGSALMLTVGSLILCLTEIARGDVCGTVLDHLSASRALLTTLLDGPGAGGHLGDFLVEYFMHTAASSLISTDPHGSRQPLLSPSIEARARALVAAGYTGQLCGCWLELLLAIAHVFELAKTLLAPVDGPSADDVITFGLLQSQVLAFFPPASASPHSQLAGLVFKQAALLYLWTMLGPPPPAAAAGAQADLIRGAVAEAVSLMDRFPASARVNTSLCWPLAVIGCCTADAGVRDVLRARLQTMIDSIGLGNMRETLVLLERVWRRPAEATSPWLLHVVMREHRTLISFA